MKKTLTSNDKAYSHKVINDRARDTSISYNLLTKLQDSVRIVSYNGIPEEEKKALFDEKMRLAHTD